MKFPISPGQYLFWTGLIYFLIGMYDVFVDKFVSVEILQVCWILILLVPVLLPIKWLVRGTPLWRN